jgi:nucleoside phosphorylase
LLTCIQITFTYRRKILYGMMAPPPPRDRRGFEIALICALQVEADAVHAIFDKFWEDEGKTYGRAQGDDNSYTTGVIGEHNVVLAYMPGMGKVNASGVAVSLRSSFIGIKLALLVGICGAAPYGTDTKTNIYLGDIIISTALIQYDFGRQYPKMFEKKDTLEDSLGRPSQKIRSTLAKLKTYHYRQKLQDNITAHLRVVQQKMPEARHPGFEMDRLFEPSYVHKHHESVTDGACDICNGDSGQTCLAALRMNCHELGCEKTRLVVRSRPMDGGEILGAPKLTVHFGKIGSADTVMKSGEDRDRIAKEDGIIAFEMEGAGVWNRFPSIVIKGACDYADSHKTKEWQGYAAATAAASTKAFLREWTPEEEPAEQGELLMVTQLVDSWREWRLILFWKYNRKQYGKFHSVESRDLLVAVKRSRCLRGSSSSPMDAQKW